MLMRYSIDKKAEDDMCMSYDENDITKEASHVAQVLHTDIKKVKDMTWPPMPEHISTDDAKDIVPISLFNFLYLLITGDLSGEISLNEPVEVPEKHQESLTIYCARHHFYNKKR